MINYRTGPRNPLAHTILSSLCHTRLSPPHNPTPDQDCIIRVMWVAGVPAGSSPQFWNWEVGTQLKHANGGGGHGGPTSWFGQEKEAPDAGHGTDD